jgi:hypothetical protein
MIACREAVDQHFRKIMEDIEAGMPDIPKDEGFEQNEDGKWVC